MSHLQYMDELVKEYLTFRGFTSTLRTLDNELKSDKDKGFRADKITDQIHNFIHTYDLSGLRELWQHLDKYIFNRLSLNLQPCVKKLEAYILKLYVVNMIQTNKQDKLAEFFEKMASELQNQNEWRDWFVLPYLKNADENPMFAMYFTRQWQDTFFVSLQNFLSIVFQNMSLPTLANYAEDAKKINLMQEEHEMLKSKLAALSTSDQATLEQIPVPDPTPPWHLMDDFYSIAQETPTSDSSLKSLKNILFGLGGGFAVPQNNRGAGTHPRRTSSQAPPEDRKRQRSSSVAPPNSQTSEHAPVKRLVQVSHASRPTSKPLRLPVEDTNYPDGPCPFILLSQEYYKDHRTIVSHAIFNNSGSLVASADTDGLVNVWTPSPTPRTESSVVMKGSITGLEWFPKREQLLIIASKYGSLRLYDVQEKKTMWDMTPDVHSELKDCRLMSVRVAPSETKFLLSTAPRNDGNTSLQPVVHLYDTKSQTLENTFHLEGSIVNSLVFNHNGSLMFCGCNDGWIRIVDLRLGDVIDSWAAHQGELFTLKLDTTESKLYSIGSDNKLSAWNLVQTGSRFFEQSLGERATGPFLIDAQDSSGRSSLHRPYGSLFALHQNKYLFGGSSVGPIIYKIGESELRSLKQLGGHQSPIITLDWNSGVECGACVATSLDGKVSISTLLSQ